MTSVIAKKNWTINVTRGLKKSKKKISKKSKKTKNVALLPQTLDFT